MGVPRVSCIFHFIFLLFVFQDLSTLNRNLLGCYQVWFKKEYLVILDLTIQYWQLLEHLERHRSIAIKISLKIRERRNRGYLYCCCYMPYCCCCMQGAFCYSFSQRTSSATQRNNDAIRIMTLAKCFIHLSLFFLHVAWRFVLVALFLVCYPYLKVRDAYFFCGS